jgi:hypothetical protein
MNEFEAWEIIMKEWQRVQRRERLSQELYDLLGGAIMHVLRTARQNNIRLPNQDRLYDMVDRIHAVGDEINEDKHINGNKLPTPTNRTTDSEQPDSEHYQNLGSVPSEGVHFGVFGYGW